MQKLKKNSLSFIITAFSLVIAIVLSFSIAFINKTKKVYSSSVANGVGFISATTSIRQTEPELVNNNYVHSFTLANNATYYLESDAAGSLVKILRSNNETPSDPSDDVFDFIQINKDNYCFSDGNYSLSNSGYATPTNWINLYQNFNKSTTIEGETFNYVILQISDCEQIEIDSLTYLYDGTNFFNFEDNIYFCKGKNNTEKADSSTDYVLFKIKLSDNPASDDYSIININNGTAERFNLIEVDGYNYKKFDNYTLATTLEEGKTYYFKSPTSNQPLQLNDGTLTHSYYTLLDENYETFAFKLDDGQPTTELDNGETINNAKYIKINENLYLPIKDNLYTFNSSNYYYDTYYKDDITKPVQNQSNPIYSLKHDSNSSNFLNSYHYVGEEGNKQRIPLSDIKYKNAKDEVKALFNNIYYDNIGNETPNETPNVALNNHIAKNSLLTGAALQENIENYYIAFGDIKHVNNLNSNVIVTGLEVTATLTNKYYSEPIKILLNDVITQSPDGSSNGNCYWYQYFDLENVYQFMGGDILDKQKVLYPEGLYTFNFKYDITDKNNAKFSDLNFSHSVYLYNTSSYANYPTLNTNVLMEGKIENEQPLYYYYNYQTNEYPTYSFDPSKFSIEYSKYYNGETTNFFTTFETKKRESYSTPTTEEDLIAKEESYIYIKKQTQAEPETIKTVLINAELYKDEDGLLTYVYVYKTKNADGSYSFSHKETTQIKYLGAEDYAVVKYLTYDPNHASNKNDVGDKVSNKIVTYESIYNANILTTINNVYSINLGPDAFGINPSTLTNPSSSIISKQTLTFSNNKFESTSISELTTKVNDSKIEINNASAINFKYLFNAENEKQIFDYNYDFIFNELGEYSIKNSYIIPSGIKQEYTKLTNDALNFNPEFKNRDFGSVNVKENEYNLSLFGVRSYFNKNGATEFLNGDINSNVSEVINNSEPYNLNLNNIDRDTISHQDIYKTLFELDNKTTKVAIPNTNMPPITFEYLCEYAYDLINNPYSKMYKFSMNQFTYDNLTQKVTLKDSSQTPIPYNFTKNTYPSTDGFYIIIIDYEYPDADATFSNEIGTQYNNDDSNKFERAYQVFAFVIDNSSPEIKIEKLVSKIESNTEISKSWKNLEKGSYTNTNVRITYSTPTFFQYDKSIQLQKTNYKGIKSTDGSAESKNWIDYQHQTGTPYALTLDLLNDLNENVNIPLVENKNSIYITKYSSNLSIVPVFKIIDKDGNEFELNGKTTFIPSDLQYISSENKHTLFNNFCVDNCIQVQVIAYNYQFIIYSTSATGDYWGSGNYDIRLKYGSNQNSYITYRFVIDTLSIENMKILAVDINDSNATINENILLDDHLIKNSFTFLYNPKESGAPIKTYYKKYTFSSSAHYGDLLLNGNNLSGVTADNFLKIGYNDELIYEYIYDYSFKTGGDTVYASNVFNPSITTLYVFELVDSAGNTANFFVIYDNSTPKYSIITKDPNAITETDGITVITDTTEVFWGNYKAIELEYFDNKNIQNVTEYLKSKNELNKFINNELINYNAKSIDKAFKEIINNSSTSFKNANIKEFYKITETNQLIEIDSSKSLTFEGSNILYDGVIINSQTVDSTHIPTTYYYLLIPIEKANFNFRNTNSDDSNTYIKNYTANEITSVYLDVNQKTLAENYNKKLYGEDTSHLQDIKNTIASSSYTNQSTSDFYKYGFYGEKYYNFTVSDVLSNQDQYVLWMNFDLTQAWAYGTFNSEKTELSRLNTHEIKLLPNESTYATGQLYFSYLPGDGSIPDSQIDYKFYNFNIDFYKNYTLTNIEVVNDAGVSIDDEEIKGDNSQNYKLTFTNGSVQTHKFIEKNKYLNTYDLITDESSDDYGKVIRTEPTSAYPFNPTSEEWTTLFSSDTNESSSYSNGTNRVFSSILKGTTSNNYLTSEQGLYVFKRTYTDYINEDGTIITDYDKNKLDNLGNDTPIRYYVYYVDRNSIIDVRNSIGLDILYKLGVGNFEDDYTTTKKAQEIENIQSATGSNNDSLTTNSSKSVSNLFSTNRNLVESEYVIDKYSAVNTFKGFVKKVNFTQTNAQLIMQKYVFNLHSNQFFLNFTLSSGTNNVFIGNNAGEANFINPSGNLSSNNFALTQINDNNEAVSMESTRKTLNNTSFSYNDLASELLKLEETRIILRKEYTYTFKIEDNAGYDDNQTKEYNKNNNNYTISYKITKNSPFGDYWGKQPNTGYNSDINDSKEYKNKLLSDFNSLLHLTTKTDSDPNSNIVSYGYSNNKTLIFAYKLKTPSTEAEINPFEVTVNKTNDDGESKPILKITTEVDNNSGKLVLKFSNTIQTDKDPSKALIYNESNPDLFLIVVFDNTTECKDYHNLLSDADENALYSITIQYKGNSSYYETNPHNDFSYFNTHNEMVIDHIKPLRNIIKLMEDDVYYSKELALKISANEINFISGYDPQNGGIDSYIANNKTTLGLTLQKNMESIYNDYMKVYQDKLNNYFFALDISDSTALDKLFINDYSGNSLIKELEHRANNGLFIRLVKDPVSYKYSLTPDDHLSNDSNAEHSVFLETTAINLEGSTLEEGKFYYFNNNLVKKLKAGNYYELIERDEAGNYRVYGVFCTYTSRYKLNYNASNQKNITDYIGGYTRTATSSNSIINNDKSIYGTDLIIDFSSNSYVDDSNVIKHEFQNSDTYQKIEFTYSFYDEVSNKPYANTSSPIIIETNPIDNVIFINMNGSTIINKISINKTDLTLNNENEFNFTSIDRVDKTNEILAYLTGIYNEIIKNNEISALDFNFNIKIYDRIGGIYNLNYNYPGKLIELEVKEIISLQTKEKELQVTIPKDSENTITRIIRFEVKKFHDNGWDSSIMDYGDNRGNTFIQYNNGKSLGGRMYFFAEGVYKFTLVDNFGRTYERIVTLNKDTITKQISFTGPVIEKIVDNSLQKYTAKPVAITYDSSYYNIALYYKLSNNSIFTPIDNIIPQKISDSFELNVELISATEKRITISPLDNKHVTIRVVLISETDKSNKEVSEFNLYTIIPNFEIENMSGKIINFSNNELFSENFNIILNTLYSDHIDFSTYIDIVFINQKNENIHLKVNTFYEVNQSGTYIIKTVNALDYSSESYTLFRDAKTTVSYSVYAIDTKAQATQLKYSSIYTSTYSPPEGGQEYLIYHYYALAKYSNCYNKKPDGKIEVSTNTDRISVITNSTNSIKHEIIELDDDKAYVLIRIYTEPSHTMHYIQINFVEESTDFTSLLITDSENSQQTEKFILKDSVNINLSSYFNNGGKEKEYYTGNLIEISYSFNGQYVKTISGNSARIIDIGGNNFFNYITLTESGVYRFTITDLAGNKQLFNGYDYYEIVLLNNIIYTINENDKDEPEVAIKNYITNKSVHLKLITQLNNIELYSITSVTASRNGNEITFEQQNQNSFLFTDAGSYLVKVTATLSNLAVIKTDIKFTIINSNVSNLSFSISSPDEFEIVEIYKKSVIAENSRFTKLEVSNKNELWLASANNETGNGYYVVTLRWYHKGMQQYYDFSFDVRINNEIPTLYANIEFGTSSSKPIIIYYNPGKIFKQVGESKIMLNDTVIAIIDSSSENSEQSYTINTSDEYWIKILDPNNRTLTTYKVTKTTPLNSTAKILIAVGVIVVVGLTVLFIVIRRRVRFR